MSVYRHIQALVRKNSDNFPVGSWLFPKKARKAIWHFYIFARNADDIADDPLIDAKEKLHRLEILRLALGSGNRKLAPDWAHPHLLDIDEGKISAGYGLTLLAAFIQDVKQNRYGTFDELLDYCRKSAVPVGQTVLELCGENQADKAAADALCIVLQLLNHLRDAEKDYRTLNRIYLPQAFLQKTGARESDLTAPEFSQGLKETYRLYLSECAYLLARAAPLMPTVKSLRLRWELSLTFELALTLYHRLSQSASPAERVIIPRWHWFYYLFKSVGHIW